MSRERWEPDMDVTEAMPIETSVFQVEKFGYDMVVSANLEMRYRDDARQEMHYRLTGYAARRMLERVEVEWPADWWQHFKQRWFPGWALRRWPVRMEWRRMEAAEWLHKRFLDRQDSRVAVEVHKPVPVTEHWIARPAPAPPDSAVDVPSTDESENERP